MNNKYRVNVCRVEPPKIQARTNGVGIWPEVNPDTDRCAKFAAVKQPRLGGFEVLADAEDDR